MLHLINYIGGVSIPDYSKHDPTIQDFIVIKDNIPKRILQIKKELENDDCVVSSYIHDILHRAFQDYCDVKSSLEHNRYVGYKENDYEIANKNFSKIKELFDETNIRSYISGKIDVIDPLKVLDVYTNQCSMDVIYKESEERFVYITKVKSISASRNKGFCPNCGYKL